MQSGPEQKPIAQSKWLKEELRGDIRSNYMVEVLNLGSTDRLGVLCHFRKL